MPALKDQLRSDLTTSMKARDQLRSSVLRMTLTAISNAEVSGTEAKELSDDEVLTIVGSEVKKRRESAEAFGQAGRQELADKELAEAEILTDYLPEQMSDDQIAATVKAAIEQTNAAGEGMKAMGKVMGVVSQQTKGKADGAAVAAEVRRQLG